MKKLIILSVGAALLGGCSATARQQNVAAGALIGAGAGAIAGSFYANPGVGAAIGAGVGGATGYVLTPR